MRKRLRRNKVSELPVDRDVARGNHSNVKWTEMATGRREAFLYAVQRIIAELHAASVTGSKDSVTCSSVVASH